MRSNAHLSILLTSLVIGAMLSGCYSSTKEVDTVPAAPVVQVPPPVVQVPAPVVVSTEPAASQTITSTSWGNGAVEQKKVTRTANGTLEKQTTTTWNNGDPSSQTSTTTTTSP